MGYFARDVMSRDVISVPVDMDVRELAKLLVEADISGAPVVDESENLVGVVSQTDLVGYNLSRDDELVVDSTFYQQARIEGHYIPKGFQIEDTNTDRVQDVMTPVVHSVTEKASVESVARLMARQHIHRVIVRRGKKVVGVISALDLLQFFAAPKRAAKKRASR